MSGFTLSDGGTEPGTGRTTQQAYDWPIVAAALGPIVKVAWSDRPGYAMFRADRGIGAVANGVTIPRTGTAWATVCEHGTIRATHTGNGARRAGNTRTEWCSKCAAGAPGIVPLVGHAPTGPSTTTQTGPVTTEAPTTTATQAGPATPDKAERKPLTQAQKEAVAKAQR